MTVLGLGGWGKLNLHNMRNVYAVVFVNTNVKTDRIAVLKGRDAIDQLDSDDTNVFQKVC